MFWGVFAARAPPAALPGGDGAAPRGSEPLQTALPAESEEASAHQSVPKGGGKRAKRGKKGEKRGQKWPKNDPKRWKMAKNGLQMVKSGPRMAKK